MNLQSALLVLITWTPVTQYTDGQPIKDPVTYGVYERNPTGGYTRVKLTAATSVQVDVNYSQGYCFQIDAILYLSTRNQIQSVFTAPVCKE